MQQLVKHVIEGRVENLTISEVIAAANVGSRQLIAATAFAQAPRLTRELADVAIAHLNGPQPIGVNLANQRYNDRLGVVCVATTYDEEAALYLARHGHSKLLFNVLNWMTAYGATPSDALVDALLTTCEQARTKGTQVDANSAGAIAGTCTKREFATPEQRNRAALIVSDLARVSSMFGFEAGPGSTWVTDVGDAACRDVLTPDVLAQVMCAMSAGNAQTFMKWVTYGIESAKPSVKVLGAVLEEISAAAWGEQNLQLAVESNQIGWDRIEGFPEILDLIVDHIGPKALHLETYVVKNRIVARLDVACEGRPETAQAIASLMEDWDGSLAKLIETGLILSGHSPDEVGVERRMVQASLF